MSGWCVASKQAKQGLITSFIHSFGPRPDRFFQRLQVEDPDVVVGHNLLGFELEVLLARATTLKVRSDE